MNGKLITIYWEQKIEKKVFLNIKKTKLKFFLYSRSNDKNINYVIKAKGNHFNKFISDLFMMTYIVGEYYMIQVYICREKFFYIYVMGQRHTSWLHI